MPGQPGLATLYSPAEALDVVRGEFGLGLPDDPGARPVLAVALEPGPELAVLDELVRHLPCVVVGAAVHGTDGLEHLSGWDVLVAPGRDVAAPWVGCEDPQAAARDLAERVAASPLASIALVQLLRLGEGASVDDGIVAESAVYSMLQGGPTFQGWLRARPDSRRGPDEGEPLLVSRSGSHLEIELNRPRVRNALNAAMRDALLSALAIATLDDSVDSVRLSGNGPAFCSGGDLDEFGLATDPASAHVVRVSRSVGAAVARCATKMVADVHGACVGAGIEIAAFCGRVCAAEDAAFSLPEVGFGLVPGAGGTVSIPRRIGRRRAAHLALSGEAIPATVALAWGLVDDIRDRPHAFSAPEGGAL